jgi:hypothetical protein
MPAVCQPPKSILASRLLEIQGRSRHEQMTLAAAWGITDYPGPAGGCCAGWGITRACT